jgi:hypothetical protein
MMQKLFYVLVFLILNSCMEKFEVPEDIINQGSSGLSAGDTTFVQIKPSWGSNYGFVNPSEISIAQDGRVYIVDSSASSIHVLNQDGDKPLGFEGLLNLADDSGIQINPTDVDIDKKMNVFFIDGSEKIFVWNQYWNDTGIKKVSTSGVFTHLETQVDTLVYYGSDLWFSILNNDEWAAKEINSEVDQSMIDSLINPHTFYDGGNETNQFLDTYYNSELSTFSGLTTTYDSENHIFVADDYGGINNQYRIMEITFQRSLLIELNNDELVWAFRGRYGSTLKGYGTGAGTVNRPVSLDMDYQGNIYYTQVGDFFPIHMLIPNLSGDFATYPSGFQPNVDDIMNAQAYNYLVDVSLDKNKNIYVVDKGGEVVTVFNSDGEYFKKAGLVGDSLSILNNPVAVAIDERGVVYVCNDGDSSIYRFKLSNSLDEDLKPED